VKRDGDRMYGVRAKRLWRGAASVAALLAGASPAWADNCFTASGNPFLVGFANGTFRQTHCGTENGFTIQSFGPDGSSNLVFFMMGADTVNGNVILAQGSILENLGISAAPPAVQAQIVGFNLGKGLPAAFPGADPGGLVITQSSIAGFVQNAGTIDGQFLGGQPGSGSPFAGERLPATNGILITNTVFSGPTAGIINSGLMELSSSPPDLVQHLKIGPFAGTGITLNGSTLAGDITNSGTIMVTATAASNGVSAKGVVLGGGQNFGRPLGAMSFTGNIVNSGTLAISADGAGVSATGVEVDSAPGTTHAGIVNSGVLSVTGTNGATGVGVKASAPITGGIANTGMLMVSVAGAKNGSSAKGIVLGGASATTDVSGNLVNSGTLAISANGVGSSATGIEVDSGQASAHAGILNSGAIGVLGTNGATGVGIKGSTPITGGITNTGLLIANTAAIDLTQETGGTTTITQAGGMIVGNVFGNGGDVLNLTGGNLVLSTASKVSGLGRFTQSAGGTLTLQVTPSTAAGSFPTIHAGTISLGGTLQVLPQGVLGNYINGVTYKDVFVSATPITGSFGSITTSIPLLTASVTPDTPDAFNVVLGLDRATLAASAQDLTQSLRLGLGSSRALIDTVQDRLVIGADYDGGLALGATTPNGEIQKPERGGVWARGYGAIGNAPASGAASSYQTNGLGVIAGADWLLTPDWLVGVAGNYANTSVDFADASHTNVGTYQGAIYSGLSAGPWYATGLAGFGVNNYNTTRQLAPFAAFGFAGAATSSPNGQTYTSYAEAGYRWSQPGFALTPYGGLGYIHTHIGAFTEEGGFGALAVNAASSDSLATDLGVRLTTRIAIAGLNPILPEIRLGWRHEFLDATQTLTASLAGLAGSNFSATGANFGRDSALVGLGATQALGSSARIFVAYDGQFTRKLNEHIFSAGFKARF
jgi:outer membrane autotransporter protein